jgi:hypothetical protein
VLGDEREVVEWAVRSVSELGLLVTGITTSETTGRVQMVVEIPKPESA